MAVHQETADDYGRVLVLLNDRWRVAVCSDGVQYLLQRRCTGAKERPWSSQSFCVTKSALERCIREKVVVSGFSVGAEAHAIELLPVRASLVAAQPSPLAPLTRLLPEEAA